MGIGGLARGDYDALLKNAQYSTILHFTPLLDYLIKLSVRLIFKQILSKPWYDLLMINLDILCFNCGAIYQVTYGTKDITKQCPKCNGK